MSARRAGARSGAAGFAVAGALLLVLVFVALSVGRYPLSAMQIAALIWAKLSGHPHGLPAAAETVMLRVRGPRVLAAAAIGAALAAAGSAYQGLFRNPLVSPDILYTEVSGGERQLALIARALAQEPSILVMDEPTASLDFGNQVRVLSEVEALARRGIAVIMSTHDPDQAFLCADRVAMLHQGRLVHLGPPQEVITRESLRAIYGVDVDVVRLDRGGRQIQVCVPSLRAGAP